MPAIHDSITGGPAGALARFGLVAAVIGAAVGVVLLSLDGFAAKHLAESWLSAPADGRASAIGPFQAEDSINFALLSPLNLVFAGFAFVLYGLAAALSHVFRAGWMDCRDRGRGRGVIGRDPGVPGRAHPGHRGPLGIAAPSIITLWLLVMGVLLVRKGAPMT